MPHCPQCTKELREFSRRCPTCHADLDLLFDYVSHLQVGLEKAEDLTRAGALGQAFWAYMEVLEVDPDNPAARTQVSQVVTAIRQFDRMALGRRWANGTLRTGDQPFWRQTWFLLTCACFFLLIGFSLGYMLGASSHEVEDPPNPEPPAVNKPLPLG